MRESKRAIYASIGANLLIATTKMIAAALTRSSVMFAEGVHSLVDAGDGGLLLVGMRRAKRPADETHQFGYGREVYFWSFVVSILFFALGGGISILEGVREIMHPEPLADPKWSYAVLAFATLFDGSSFVVAYRAFRKTQKGRGVWSTIKRSKDPTQFAVLLEDSADLAGIAIAFLGLLLSQHFDNPVFDAAGSFGVGLLLMGVAAVLAYETKSLLLGESAGADTTASLRAIARRDDHVTAVHDVMTVQLSPGDVLVVLELSFTPTLSATETAAATARLRRQIQAEHPEIRRVYIHGVA